MEERHSQLKLSSGFQGGKLFIEHDVMVLLSPRKNKQHKIKNNYVPQQRQHQSLPCLN